MAKINIACAGYSCGSYIDILYPKKTAEIDRLKHYSEVFNTIEIDSTFYKSPGTKKIKEWYVNTPADFKFYIKVCKEITHTHKMHDMHGKAEDFCKQYADILSDKLAGFVYLLPPSFYNNEDNQKALFSNLSSEFDNYIEFRNASWWGDDKLLAKMKRRKITMIGVSIPGFDIPDLVITRSRNQLYHKMYGSPFIYKSEYSKTYLNALAEEVKLQKKDINIVFCNTNTDAAIKNATYLKALIAE